MNNIFAIIFLTLIYSPFVKSESGEHLTVKIPSKIGFEQVLTVKINLSGLEKTRDLHVSVQQFPDFKRVAKTMKRISKNGNYHFDLEIKNSVPGKYRLVAYLTPKGKDWNSRVVQVPHQNIEVVEKAIFTEKQIVDIVDKVKLVKFPKVISGKEEAELSISYIVTQPRTLHIRLTDSETWKEIGTLKFPVTSSGDLSIPLANMTDDFPPGKYAWIINLVESDTRENVSKNYGKHFELVK